MDSYRIIFIGTVFIIGAIFASVLIYYGMCLYSRAYFSIKQDSPMGKQPDMPTEQENTEEI